jgi:hypothetical protein
MYSEVLFSLSRLLYLLLVSSQWNSFFQGLDLPEIIVESEKRGITFDKLLTVPEKDNWVYTDGKSASCVAYVLTMYKEAGLFDPIASSIEVTEFTVSTPDSLVLKLMLLWIYRHLMLEQLSKISAAGICFAKASLFSSAWWPSSLEREVGDLEGQVVLGLVH